MEEQQNRQTTDQVAQAWKILLPEEVQMDTHLLAHAYDDLIANFPAIKEMVIIRHGMIAYHRQNSNAREGVRSKVLRSLLRKWARLVKAPRGSFLDRDAKRWNIRSVTSSILSAFLGIALEQKCIDNLDQKVIEFIPKYFPSGDGLHKKGITLRHLLTMTSGLQSIESRRAFLEMLSSRDWTRYILELPLINQPGELFNYSSANAHLLAAVLNKVYGNNLFDFAKKQFFQPLGITDIAWEASPEGVPFGGGNLFMTATDMAKIGQLYLQEGVWEGQQIIPAHWIRESTRRFFAYSPGWDYGYAWYIRDENDEENNKTYFTYSAIGTGGQKILVIPDLDIVLSATAYTNFIGDRSQYLNTRIGKYLLAAIQNKS